MTEIFIDGLKRCLSYVTLDICVFAANGCVFLTFVIFLFANLKKQFKHVSFILITLQALALTVIQPSYALLLTLISLVFSSFLYLFLKIPRVKSSKAVKLTAQEFVKTLDKKLRANETYRPQAVMQEKDVLPTIIDSGVNNAKKGLNVSHARSIIEKLNFLDLAAPDKLKVAEIERALFDLERESGASSFFKVNEKLSALIKILAKYQV